MLYNFKRKKLCRHLLAGGALCLAGLAFFSCSDTYDLDTEQPSGLNSIYGFMEKKGNFKNFLHLIDDLGQKPILSLTGSKTLFVADDDAFAKFFADNEWKVSSYDELTWAQKNLLLHAAMIDNPYPTSMLSTAEGPVKGEICRRASSQSLWDSVEIVRTDDPSIPANSHWETIRQRGGEIVLFKDESSAPTMIHFTPNFVRGNKLLPTDIDFLYNDKDGTFNGNTYVNDSKILESEFCKNGFVHVVDRVITPMDNLAEKLTKIPEVSEYSKILERFAAPKDSAYLTSQYNQRYGTDYDSVFVKHYLAKRSIGSTFSTNVAFNRDKDSKVMNVVVPDQELLKFDPGWNGYLPDIFNNRNPMMEDMAVMVVPTNEALERWFYDKEGTGYDIRTAFETLDNVPLSTIKSLVNVNMHNSLVSTLPSNFANVLNDANEPYNLTKDDVVKVYHASNGMIYVVNRVIPPAVYSSVLFPTEIDTENFNIIRAAIDKLDYGAYLNSMASTYSYFLPVNSALTFIDPVSAAKSKPYLWEFHYDSDKKQVYAELYEYTIGDDGQVQKGDYYAKYQGLDNAQLNNRMEYILDNIIGVEAVKDQKKGVEREYIITKGKSYVKVGGNIDVEGEMTAAGSLQQGGTPVNVTHVYPKENGTTYVTDGIVMPTMKSTADVLAEHPEFDIFSTIVEECGIVGRITTDGYAAASVRGNLISYNRNWKVAEGAEKDWTSYALLNAYHYTLYAPTNAAMEIAFEAGLPSLDDLNDAIQFDEDNLALEEPVQTDSAGHIRAIWRDFVRYHIQTSSLYLGEGFENGNYETSKNRLDFRGSETDGVFIAEKTNNGAYSVISGSPYRLTVNYTGGKGSRGLDVTDASGIKHHVGKEVGPCNLVAHEWWLGDQKTSVCKLKDVEQAEYIRNSSSIVIHAIDGPLFYKKEKGEKAGEGYTQFEYYPREVFDDSNAKRRK